VGDGFAAASEAVEESESNAGLLFEMYSGVVPVREERLQIALDEMFVGVTSYLASALSRKRDPRLPLSHRHERHAFHMTEPETFQGCHHYVTTLRWELTARKAITNDTYTLHSRHRMSHPFMMTKD